MYPLGQMLAHCDVVFLQIVLNVLAVDNGIRREILSSKEEGEESLASQSVVIRTPKHFWELSRIWIDIMYKRSLGY